MAQSLLGLANTYEMKGDLQSAVKTYQEACSIAEDIGAKIERKEAYEGLALTYSKLSDYKNAFKFHIIYKIKETLYDDEKDKKLQTMTLSFDLEQKQGEINLRPRTKPCRSSI